MSRPHRALTLLILSLVVMTMGTFVFLTGCSTSSTGPETVEPDFRSRLSPEDVIYNLVMAYERMDAEEYLDCLSEDFVFYPSEDDYQNDPTIPESWDKTTETGIHDNMFDPDGDVESITLTLMTTDIDTMPGMLPDDPSDDVVVYTVAVDLWVNVFGGITYLATSPSEFRFRMDEDQTGPSGQDLWEIFEWYDLMDERQTSRAGESSTWTSIKAMCRSESSWGTVKAMFR